MSDQPDPSNYSDPADFAAAWQAANPDGGQVDVVADPDGDISVAGPVITPDDYE